jgi:hypothetical protein
MISRKMAAFVIAALRNKKNLDDYHLLLYQGIYYDSIPEKWTPAEETQVTSGVSRNVLQRTVEMGRDSSTTM